MDTDFVTQGNIQHSTPNVQDREKDGWLTQVVDEASKILPFLYFACRVGRGFNFSEGASRPHERRLTCADFLCWQAKRWPAGGFYFGQTSGWLGCFPVAPCQIFKQIRMSKIRSRRLRATQQVVCAIQTEFVLVPRHTLARVFGIFLTHQYSTSFQGVPRPSTTVHDLPRQSKKWKN